MSSCCDDQNQQVKSSCCQDDNKSSKLDSDSQNPPKNFFLKFLWKKGKADAEKNIDKQPKKEGCC